MARIGSTSSYEKELQKYFLELNLYSDKRQVQDINHKAREDTLEKIGRLFMQAVQDKVDCRLILKLDAICLAAEYGAIEQNSGLDLKAKESRLKSLNEATIDNLYAQDDVQLLQDSPGMYAKRIKEAYGPYRQVKFPPSGDRARKYVDAQVKRLAKLDAGFRSSGESEFFRKRQLALKSLQDKYIDMQCQALGLVTPKKEFSKEKGLEL